MFNTIAYCLGFTSNGLTPVNEHQDLNFVTKEADEWTIVDLDKTKGTDDQNESLPTPQSPRENLLIEHPSMFVKLPKDLKKEPEKEKKAAVVQHRHKPAPSSLRRSQRKAARDAVAALSVQQRKRHQFKHAASDVARRNNKTFQKMRQIVHQPRKHC